MKYIKKERKGWVIYERVTGPLSAESVRVISTHRTPVAARRALHARCRAGGKK